MKTEACLRLVGSKKRDAGAALVEVYHWTPEHLEHTENVNDDLLIQAINDVDLVEDAVGSCEASIYPHICGNSNPIKTSWED